VTTEPPSDGQDGAADDLPPVELPAVELAKENEELRHELEARGQKKKRGRTIGAWVLLVLACLLAVMSVVVVYARNQLLNTDTFVSTLAPLASDPAVQTAVATRVSDSLVAQTDLEQRVKNALPARADFLANPITSTVKTASYDITLKLVQSSQFQKLWEQALRQSHQQLDNLLLGNKVGALNSANGQVTVDLTQVENKAKQVLSQHGLSVFNKVPQYTGKPYILFQSKQLLKLQRWVKFLNKLALVLPIVSLLLFAVSVVLARDRRRGLVHAAAGLAVSMAVLLIAANVGRNQYLASLLPGQSKDATAAVIDTVDASLLDSVRTLLILAAVVALVAFVVGLGPVRRWWSNRTTPSWLTSGPVHDAVAAHRRAYQWLVVGLGLLVLVLWNQPTVKVALIVLLVTFLFVIVVGVYGRAATGTGSTPPDGGPPADTGVPTGAATS
jgi:hypothetical protein